MIFAISILSIIPIAVTVLLYRIYSGTYKVFQQFQYKKIPDTPEIHEPVKLNPESGRVPSWLNGIMYRISPGMFEIKREDGSTFSIQHAFDGLPFMHRFQISGQTQTVKYNSRMLVKSIMEDIKKKEESVSIFFGHALKISFVDWIKKIVTRIDNIIIRPKYPNTKEPDSHCVGVTATPNFPLPSLLHTADKVENILVSKTDANFMQKINAETLVPEALFSYADFDSSLTDRLAAAHHQFDPKTGETFNMTLTFAPCPRLKVFSISKAGETTILADMMHRKTEDNSPIRASYVHSFWITENYIIIPEFPLFFKDRELNVFLYGSLISALTWDRKDPTYFHIISRHPSRSEEKGLIASIPFTGFFHFHTANAYEEINTDGDTILTLDSASFSDGNVAFQLHDHNLPKEHSAPPLKIYGTYFNGIKMPPPKQERYADLCRYKLNLNGKKMVERVVLAENIEFVRFNQDYMFKDYSYVYGSELKLKSDKTQGGVGVVKVNVKEKSSIHYHDDGFVCSETIFVKRPGGEVEDDGVLLALANSKESCYLIILNAIDLKKICRFKLGAFSATTFHGSYVDHEFKSVNVN